MLVLLPLIKNDRCKIYPTYSNGQTKTFKVNFTYSFAT